MKHSTHTVLQFFAEAAAAPAAAAATDAPAASGAENRTGAPADPSAADEAFEKLIKGDYADAFGRRVQKIIDGRFKKSKADAESLETLTAAITKAHPEFAGKSAGEMAALLPTVEGGAKPAQKEPDETDRLLSAAAARLRAGNRHRAARQVIAEWEAQAGEMQARYPAFGLKAALREPGPFGQLLKAGVPLRTAYEAAHLEEILGEAMRYAAQRAGEQAANALLEQKRRPQENPVASRAATRTAADVNSLTGNDIMRILGEVSRGAKITFK